MANEENIKNIAEIAQSTDFSFEVKWEKLSCSKEELFEKVSASVLNDFESIQDDQKVVVMLATLVKTLVENILLKSALNDSKEHE